jgi:adenine-specific DNA-methyltransferase
MIKEIFKYLGSITSMEPISVNRLLISSFIEINNYIVKNNKLLKSYLITEENEEEFKHLQEILTLIRKNTGQFSFEDLIQLFEFVISPVDKIVTGAVYTPEIVRKFIILNTLSNKSIVLENSKIADISCGCGGFLFDVAKKLKYLENKTYQKIFQNNLFGLDIQEYSITRTELILTLLAISEGEDIEEFKFNLFLGDALSFNWSEKIQQFRGFDVILGNPPYVCSKISLLKQRNC